MRAEFDRILRFWFDRGVAGFRIDVCNLIVKDAELRDNPPATDDDDPGDAGARAARRLQRQPARGARRDPALARDRRLLRRAAGADRRDAGRGRATSWRASTATTATSCTSRSTSRSSPRRSRPNRCATIVEQTEALLPPGAWPAWTGSNHDMSRLATRWAGDDPRKIRVALMMLLTLRGTPVLYQGDEIGLGDVAGRARADARPARRPVLARTTRDATRCAHRCTGATRPAAASPSPASTPWLPLGDTAACNVEDQVDDPDSILVLTRDLIALRAGARDLASGSYRRWPRPTACGRGSAARGSWS